MKKLFLSLFWMVLFSYCSNAATYYVSTNGSNSNPGSSGSPWLTVQYAVNTMVAGDTAIVRAGTYPEYVSTTKSGTSGSPITVLSTENAQIYALRLNDHQWYVIDGLTFKGAMNTWDSYVRIENDANNNVIKNCIFGPGIFAYEYGMYISTNTMTISNSVVNWGDKGFRVGGNVYIGSSGLPGYEYNNFGYNWTITSITNDVMGISLASGTLTNEVSGPLWAPVGAGTSYEGVIGIKFVPSGGYSASNIVIANNLFTNLWGSAVDFSFAQTVVMTNNTIRGLNGYKGMVLSGNDLIISNNLFLDCTNFVHYSPAEIGTFYHPAGGSRVYDYQIGFLHTGAGIAKRVQFVNNWLQNVHNPIGQFDDDVTSTNLLIARNVFVGVGASMSGGQNGTFVYSNTFFKVAYEEGQSTALTLGAGGITNVGIRGNLFVDVGYHSTTNPGYYTVSLSTQVETNYNLVAGAETMLFGPARLFSETNGLNGINPLFVNPLDPLGPDGLPFTEDDGLKPMPNSPIALLSWGALAPKILTNYYPIAYFNQTGVSLWQEDTSTNYNSDWRALPFYERTNKIRPFGTPETLGTVPLLVTFTATNSISSTFSTNDWYGIKDFQWDFGDGSEIWTKQPTQSHTFLTPGTYTVALTVYNSSGYSNRTTRQYIVGDEAASFTNNIYHVMTNGNDTTGDGSYTNPWVTITKAKNTVVAGDYVAVHTGDYPEFIDVNRNVATTTNRISFIGYGARTGGFKTRYSDYTIDGFVLDRSLMGDVALGTVYVYQDADNILIRNNRFLDTTNGIRGIYVAASGNLAPTNGSVAGIVDNNIFTNINYIVIEISNGSNWVISANQAMDTGSEGDFIRPLGSGHIIRDNWISNLNNKGTGGHSDFIQLPIGTTWFRDILIERNWIQGDLSNLSSPNDAAIGQLASNRFADSTVTNIIFRNNIFYYVRGTLSDSADGIKFYNNLFYVSPRDGGNVTAGGGVNGSSYGTIFYNNIFFKNAYGTANNSGWYFNATDVTGPSTNTTVFADYNFVTGSNYVAKLVAPPDDVYHWGAAPNTLEVNGINGGDPYFVNAAAGDFRLRSNSPLLNAGTNLSSEFTTDYLGRVRTGWSIGPFDAAGDNSPSSQQRIINVNTANVSNLIIVQ